MSGKRAKESRRALRVNLQAQVLFPGDPIPKDAEGVVLRVPIPSFRRAAALAVRIKALSNGRVDGTGSSLLHGLIEGGLVHLEALGDDDLVSSLPGLVLH